VRGGRHKRSGQHERGCQHERSGQIGPEDRPPAGDGQDGRARERPEGGARLLHGADHAERQPAAIGRPRLGDHSQGRGHQAATADTLQGSTRDQGAQVGRCRCDQAAEGEDEQAAEQHRTASAQVSEPSDQRQGGDVAEQERGDDRGRALELVHADADAGHHVRQRQHDDIGVRGGQEHRQRGHAQSRAPPTRGPIHRP
jgi:hypothetical protein